MLGKDDQRIPGLHDDITGRLHFYGAAPSVQDNIHVVVALKAAHILAINE